MFFFKTHTCHNMAIVFIKFIKQVSVEHHETFHKTKQLPMQPAWKNRNSNQQYYLHIKRETLKMFFEKNFRYKTQSQSNVYYLKFYRNFIIEYSLSSIVKLKFTRRNVI